MRKMARVARPAPQFVHPTITLARRLAPESIRIRQRLALVEDCLQRYSRDGVLIEGRHRIHEVGFLLVGLEKLCHEVLAEIGITADGEFYETARSGWPEPTDYHSAIRWMADAAYIETNVWRVGQRCALREGADPDLLSWLDALIEDFRLRKVPLQPTCIVQSRQEHAKNFVTGVVDVSYDDCPFSQGYALEVGHCQYGIGLPDACWNVIRAVGSELADRRDIAFEDSLDGPERWVLRGWRDLKAQPRRIEFPKKHRWSRSPPGEREMLEAYFGLTNERWTGDPFGGWPDETDGDFPTDGDPPGEED